MSAGRYTVAVTRVAQRQISSLLHGERAEIAAAMRRLAQGPRGRPFRTPDGMGMAYVEPTRRFIITYKAKGLRGGNPGPSLSGKVTVLTVWPKRPRTP